MAIDVARLRPRFPTLEHKIYLNSGSYGLLSLDVKQAFERYIADRIERGSDWMGWTERGEETRARIARLLSADGDEIAITASASAGINSIASALKFDDGRDKIVISNFEFPTSGQIWHAQAQRGARIEHVPEDENGCIPIEHFERAIDERTKIVVIAHVCYRNGAKLENVAEIVKIAHRHGALVILDCFQSVGAVPVNVREMGVDFAVGGMLKYLLGTAGIGFLYARRNVARSVTPSVTGWFAQADIGKMDMFNNDPAPNAARFQAGTPPVVNCYAANAGLDIILEHNIGEIEAHVRELSSRLMRGLRAEGFRIATPSDDARRGPMVCIRSTNEQLLVEKLAEQNIVTSFRDGNVRAMFHLYNNDDDVTALLEGLRAHRSLIKLA
jgi:selenocysteine lyase/cysteine desulfurase